MWEVQKKQWFFIVSSFLKILSENTIFCNGDIGRPNGDISRPNSDITRPHGETLDTTAFFAKEDSSVQERPQIMPFEATAEKSTTWKM